MHMKHLQDKYPQAIENSDFCNDFYDQLSQLKNMGSLDEIAAMMPGMNAGALKGAQVDEKAMGRTAAIIQSMTPYERENPSVLNSSRKRRIALGAGVKVEDINKRLPDDIRYAYDGQVLLCP